MLGGVALVGLRPWATDSVGPDLSVSPGLGVALGDAVAVAPDRSAGVAAGRVVPTESTPAVDAASISAPARGGAGPALAVAPAQALSRPTAIPVSSPQPKPVAPAPAPEPEPVAAAPEPPPVPASPAPIVAGYGGGEGSHGPILGGVNPPPSCEGDEYTITVTLDEIPGEGEDIGVKILIQRFEKDGTVSELELEGDLGDVRDLAGLLESEGNCVQVVFEPPLGEESTQAPSESDTAPTELDSTLEPALP